MWIRIGNRLFNTDDFREIIQETVIYEDDGNCPPRPVIYAKRKDGVEIKISDEPIINQIANALDAKEVF